MADTASTHTRTLTADEIEQRYGEEAAAALIEQLDDRGEFDASSPPGDVERDGR